jgi:hypothetical protein
MSGNIVNFFNASTNTATTNTNNDGAPQVSILAAANTRANLQKKKRGQSHSGKKYPGVGTHRRNTKHVWLFSELAELSGAYKEHHTTMPCWTIAEMLHYSFSQQIQYNQTKHAQQEQEAVDEEAIAQQQEPRAHLPTIQAIQSKLLDCIMLQHSDTTFGYAAQPSQMHRQVWEHLELAEKHRTMLKKMTAAAPVQQIKQEQQEKEQQDDKPLHDDPLNTLAPVWNVHPRSFYTPDAEFEAAQPPTKRRKVESDDDDAPASKAEFDAGIKEIMSLLEDTEEVRRQERTLIQQLVAQIREHNDQLGSLVSNIKDSHEEIEQHRQAIAHKMQQIESVIAAPAASATLTTLSTPTTPICTKCTKRIEGDLGGFSVYRAAAADSTPPQSQGTTTYECDNCAPISPATRQYFERMQAETEAGEMSDDGEYAIDFDFEGDRVGSNEGEEESRHTSFWRFYYDGQEAMEEI